MSLVIRVFQRNNTNRAIRVGLDILRDQHIECAQVLITAHAHSVVSKGLVKVAAYGGAYGLECIRHPARCHRKLTLARHKALLLCTPLQQMLPSP